MRLPHFILHAFYHRFLPFPQSLFPVHSFSFQLFFFCFLSVYWVLNFNYYIFHFRSCIYFPNLLIFLSHNSIFFFYIFNHKTELIPDCGSMTAGSGNIVLPSVMSAGSCSWWLISSCEILWWQMGQASFVSVFLKLSCLVPCLLCSFFRGSSVPANRFV